MAVNPRTHEKAAQSPPAMERTYDKFRAGKINLLEYDYKDLIIKLSVEEIVHRKRRSGFFEYQNLKELNLKHAAFDIYLYSPVHSVNNHGIPFDLLERCVHLLPGAGEAKPLESYLQETSDVDLDVLSRIQIDFFTLNIHYSTGASLEVAAEKAFLGGDFMSFVLEGNVKILTPNGEVVRAPQAVFSRRYEGILFPSGHCWKETCVRQKTFYRLKADGRLVRLPELPDVRYADPLAAKEEELYGKIFSKLPPYQRVMFGIPAPQQQGLNAEKKRGEK